MADRQRWMDQATRLLVVLILLAVLLNGLPFWARRVGLLDRQAYAQDLMRFCRVPLQPWWLPASCGPHRLVQLGSPLRMQRIEVLRLYRISPAEALMKGGRYLILLLLLLGSGLLLVARWYPFPAPSTLLPLLPLALSTLTSALIGLPADGLTATVLSLVWALWIPLAALGGWLTTPRRLQCLADGAAALLILQIPFLLVEVMRGLPMPFGGPSFPWLPTRLSGLMIQPNTLGGVLAISVALCMAFSRRRWQHWPLLCLALALVVPARSGTGVVTLLALAAWRLLADLPRRWRPFPLVGLLVVVLVLPQLLGRPQLFDSPSGRVRTLRVWIGNPRSLQERWLGLGLAAPNDDLRKAPSLQGIEGYRPERRGLSADGMPLVLLSQGGLLALVAFYGLVGWCFWRDPPLRPLWLVLLISSLTLNLTQVFPVGIWLAVAVARGLSGPFRPAGPRG